MNRSLTRIITTTAVVALTTVGASSGAHASEDRSVSAKSPRVIATGSCGNAATKLKVSAEDTGTQVEFELDQNVSGKKWALVLKRGGSVIGKANRTTSGPSGSLHWRVRPSGASNGTFSVTSTRGATSCTLTASL
jgi:hypothetical protein